MPTRKRRGRPSKINFAPLRRTASVTLCSASYWLTWAEPMRRFGKEGVALPSIPRRATLKAVIYNQFQLVRIYILVGQPEKALDELETLLKNPGYLSPGWLRIDPTFDPLRENPRFQKLLAGGK